MSLDKNGIYRYEPTTPVQSMEAMLNLGASSVSSAVGKLTEAAYFGGWITTKDFITAKTAAEEANKRTSVSAAPGRPMFFYITSHRMFVTWDGVAFTRVAGGVLNEYIYLSNNGDISVRSGQRVTLGTQQFTIPATSQALLSLSSLVLPDAGANGNFWPELNGARVSPNASWTSYGSNSRMPLWFVWPVTLRQGQNTIVWKYEHSSNANNNARTDLSIVHAWVRY